MKLSDVKIRNAKPGKKPYKLSDGNGLFLYMHPAGGRYWRLKYRWAGKERQLALGVYPIVGLADARERCIEARKMMAAGKDPGEVKKEAKRVIMTKSESTFEIVAREWHENNKHTWVPKHSANVLKRLEGDIFPKLGNRPIADINAPELLSVLKIIEKRGALDLTRTIAQYCSRIFAYAIATGRGERNPATDLRGALKTPVKNTMPI